jgi:O-antigen/teichoic acid export membrane protein
MSTTTRRSSLVVPAGCVLMAAVFFAAFAANGHVGEGAAAAVLMLAYAALLLLGGRRSQYLRMLRGHNDDERTAMIEQRAGLVAGYAVLIAMLVGFVQAVVRDVDPAPYTWLGALSGLSYGVALAVLRRRS